MEHPPFAPVAGARGPARTKIIYVRCSADEASALKLYATARSSTVGDLVRAALTAYLLATPALEQKPTKGKTTK